MSQQIKAKFNRGPNHGKRMVLMGHESRIEVMKPPSVVDIISAKEFSDVPLLFQKGSYQKSNRQLKDGTWIFEWMGWYA